MRCGSISTLAAVLPCAVLPLARAARREAATLLAHAMQKWTEGRREGESRACALLRNVRASAADNEARMAGLRLPGRRRKLYAWQQPVRPLL